MGKKQSVLNRWTRFGLIAMAVSTVGATTSFGAITPEGEFTPLPWASGTNVTIGTTTYGKVTIDGGTQTAVNTFTTGDQISGDGHVVIRGANTKLTVAGTVSNGKSGIGAIQIGSGATLKANSIQASTVMANSASSGVFSVSGAGSLLDVTTNAFIGLNGNGALNVSTGAKATIGGVLIFGNYAGSTASLSLQDANSKITAASLTTGDGQANLNISNGASMATDEAVIGTGGAATVAITSGGTWTNTGTLYLGGTKTADFQVGANSTANLSVSRINGTSGAQGHLMASGSQANINYDYLFVGDTGYGSLTSKNGATITGSSLLVGVHAGSQGHVYIDGGTVQADIAYVAYDANSTGIVEITNGGTFKSNLLILGSGGSSTLVIGDGAAQIADGATLALTSGSRAALVMYGPNSSLTTKHMDIGFGGTADIYLDDHAQMTTTSATVGGGATGNGTVNVGNGSHWQATDVTVGGTNNAKTDGHVTITDHGSIYTNQFLLQAGGDLTLLGGELSFSSLFLLPGSEVKFYAGKLEWRGDHTFYASDSLNNLLDNSSRVKVGQTFAITGKADFGTPFEIDGGTLQVGHMGTGQIVFTRGTFEIMNDGLTVDNGQVFGNTLNVRHDTIYKAQFVNNKGLITGNGDIIASINNTATGRIQVGMGNRLHFSDGGSLGSHTNSGVVELAGGTIHFDGNLTNNASGVIKGYGTLQVDNQYNSQGLTNLGSIYLTGHSGIIGNVNNQALISLSGLGPNDFYNNVKNNGEIRVAQGSQAIFLGQYSGAGQITGGGKTFFEGSVAPGNSPAIMMVDGNVKFGTGSTLDVEIGGLLAGAQYDKLQVTGTLEIGGTLLVSLYNLGNGTFIPQAGDSFDILDWGTLSGTFSNLQLAQLPAGLGWDVSQLYTTGVISVGVGSNIPEPATLLAFSAGCVGMLMRRGKRK